MKYYLAIDIGASSGRHIIGYDDNKLVMDEVYRFKNQVKQENNHLIWDLKSLFENVLIGIKIALEKYPNIESMSIDTWGVDYVLMNNDNEILPCYSYRDDRTDSVINKVHDIIPFEKLYEMTG
ncbi:MAG: FGGY family carbohydrate kinase, partial [Erysipelotrichaceae bacterium]|nr:FGGY family carbohydrate kinase [Erysipelotrichaceae bacterium]